MDLAEKLADSVRQELLSQAKQEKQMGTGPGSRGAAEPRVIGPAAATISRINDIFRFAFYVKSEKYDILIKIKDSLEKQLRQNPSGTETVQFDFDPMNTM